jgi:hypothetical protein
MAATCTAPLAETDVDLSSTPPAGAPRHQMQRFLKPQHHPMDRLLLKR